MEGASGTSPAAGPGLVRTVVVASAVVASFGVFVLPWLIPPTPSIVQSESLALGFNNRIAMVALGACVVLAMLATRYFRLSSTDAPLVSLRPAPPSERVSRRTLWTAIGVSVAVVGLQAAVLGSHAHGDAQYFVDRILRVAAGGVPFSTVEFAYGPLMIYAPYLLWRLGAPIGLSVHDAYYLWVAISYALGVGITAYLVDRLPLLRRTRTLALLLVVAMMLLNTTLGANYSPFRFLLPYALLLWSIERVTRSPHAFIQWTAPVVAVLLMMSITPEMGVACLAAVATSLALLVRSGDRRARGPLLAVRGLAVALVVALFLRQSGTVDAFAAGAFYLPVLPGPAALLYVGSMLLVAWGVAGSRYGDRSITAAEVGWLALGVLLIVPSLGRADFVHIFWNGAGVLLLCLGLMHLRWQRAAAYLRGVTVVFLTSMVAFTGLFSAGILASDVYCAICADPVAAEVVSTLRGLPAEQGLEVSAEIREDRLAHEEAAAELSSVPMLAAPDLLVGEEGEAIAMSGNLVNVYYAALSDVDFVRAREQLSPAQYLVLPTFRLGVYQAAAARAESGPDGVTVSVPHQVGGELWYGILLGMPVTFEGRNPVFDPDASFGALLEQDWVEERTVGSYTLLRRREMPDETDPADPVRRER